MSKFFLSLLISGFYLLTSNTALASDNTKPEKELPPCLKECREAYKEGKTIKDFKYSDLQEVYEGMGGAYARGALRKELRQLETCDTKRSTCWWLLKKAGKALTGSNVFSDCHSTCITQYQEYLSED